MSSNLEKDRYSLCVVYADESGLNTYYKYYRVADFEPSKHGGNLVPAIIQTDAGSVEEAYLSPDYLYNPAAAKNHGTRDSDFYLFQWKPNPEIQFKCITVSKYDDNAPAELQVINQVHEVFELKNCDDVEDLRDALAEGFPAGGLTTDVFYVAYEDLGDKLGAVRCKKKDFVFADGMLKLFDDPANVRSTVIAAPKVYLNRADIIESPHKETSDRKIYADLREPQTVGTVLLRPLKYYAADYLQWFIKAESLPLSKTERRELVHIVNNALSRPDILEQYLSTDIPEEEINDFRKQVVVSFQAQEEAAQAVVREALLSDETFRQECIDEVVNDSDEVLKATRLRVTQTQNELAMVEAELSKMKAELAESEKQRVANEERSSELEQGIESMKDLRDKLATEMEDNLLLKLGLKATLSAVSQRDEEAEERRREEEQQRLRRLEELEERLVSEGQQRQEDEMDRLQKLLELQGHEVPVKQTSLHIDPSVKAKCKAAEVSLHVAVENNLKELGIVSVSGDSLHERRNLAVSVESALAITKILVAPQPIAKVLADALSIAINGRTAASIQVPSDSREINDLLGSLEGKNNVYLVDNVIDSVNEAMISALLYAPVMPIVILPFMSHASMRLVANEAWERMFYADSEGLVWCSPGTKSRDLVKMKSAFVPDSIPSDNVVGAAQALRNELKAVGVSDGVAILASSVLLAASDIVGDEPTEPFIFQHLAVSSVHDMYAADDLLAWSGNNTGLLLLLERLGLHESQS